MGKYKQVMDNKKKEMTEKNEQIKELKEALAKKKTTMRSLNDDDGNSNNANVDLLTKRLSVLANLLQQKKAIIDKLMKGANEKKAEIGKLNAQLVVNNKMLSEEKQKAMLRQGEIKALHQIRDGLTQQIEQQKKQMNKVEHELKALKMAKTQKEKSLTPQVQPPANVNVVKLSGNKRKRNMMNEEDAMRMSENKQSIEPPFKRYKATTNDGEEEIKSQLINVDKDDATAPPLESVSNANDDEDNGNMTPITDVDDEEEENENDDDADEEATSEDGEEDEEEYSDSDEEDQDEEDEEDDDDDGGGTDSDKMIDLCSSDDGN